MGGIRIEGNESQRHYNVQFSWPQVSCVPADPQLRITRANRVKAGQVQYEVIDKDHNSFLFTSPGALVGDRSPELLAKTALEVAKAQGIDAVSVDLNWD